MDYATTHPAASTSAAARRWSSAGGVEARASLRSLWTTLRSRRLIFLVIILASLLLCLVYCLFAPREYQATARVALRSSSEVPLSIDGSGSTHANLGATSQAELETLASVLRSDQLAWRVIMEEKLYSQTAFSGTFSSLFPGFKIETATPAAQAWLLDRFCRRLHVATVPRTLVVEIDFRSRDAALSAHIVNALIRAYNEQDSENRLQATAQATHWLYEQLASLKTTVDSDDQKLADFQRQHNLIYAPVRAANGQTDQVEHSAIVQGIDTLGQQFVDASAEQMLRTAEYRAAMNGDPETVVASDPRLAADGAGFGAQLLHQLNAQRSALEQELAQLNMEHGPNFPRTLEARSQIADIDRQIKTQKSRIISGLRAAMIAAENRAGLLRAGLQTTTVEGLNQNQAAAQFAVMQQEAESRRAVYFQVLQKAREAGMQAGVEQSNLSVVDFAHQPIKPVTPDPLVDFALTLFVSFWLALGAVLVAEAVNPSSARYVVLFLGIIFGAFVLHAQAPTPSTSGLPTGVARIPQSDQRYATPNAKDAPAVWSFSAPSPGSGAFTTGIVDSGLPAPLAPGDTVIVNEATEPIVHTVARVSDSGTVSVPLAGDVRVAGFNETGAARAIEDALIARGMLRHPQITVLVTSYVGEDVSILGEVARPGIYPYTAHHRLLDFIAAAEGLAPTAGSLAFITPRDSKMRPIAVMLDETDAAGDHNPELLPGDTVEVAKAGIIYVVGDVMRPGGFAIDPSQNLTVVRALTLAWGPTQNAALGKALLICDQRGGRTVTQLNLKRMLRGQDPDLPIHDRDILFVPDSAAKNLWNRTMESVVQSAAGVSIYAGLVYSQRF